MKDLRQKFNRFCFRHRDKGIPNLMLYIALGTAVVYVMTMYLREYTLYNLLAFSRDAIFQGQVWRLFTYPLTHFIQNPLLMFVSLLCYYSLARAVENVWGTLRFNLFYLCGIVMMDIYCLIFNCQADVYYLNMSLLLAYATMFPDAQFLIFFIIPIKARILALVDLALVLFGMFFDSFPYNLFPLIAIANYFLFFGKDVANVFPVSWRINARRLFRKKSSGQGRPNVVPFPSAGSYQATVAKPKPDYTHRCVVCGRTDVSDPTLEFRYCSRCSGYRCYCEEHINHHEHVRDEIEN